MTEPIEVFQRADGQWAFRVKGENGEVMSQSEGYANVFNANRGAQSLVRRLKDVDKNAIASIDAQPKDPEIEIRTFDSNGMRTLDSVGTGVTRKNRGPLGEVVDATGMQVDVDDNKVIITVLGPNKKDSYRMVIKGENLKLLKDRLIAADNAAPTREVYLLSVIRHASKNTSTPLSIESLIELVQNNRGDGINPFDVETLETDVRSEVIDLFFARKIKTDNISGLVLVERGGR